MWRNEPRCGEMSPLHASKVGRIEILGSITDRGADSMIRVNPRRHFMTALDFVLK